MSKTLTKLRAAAAKVEKPSATHQAAHEDRRQILFDGMPAANPPGKLGSTKRQGAVDDLPLFQNTKESESMTQDEQDRDLADAQVYLSVTTLTVNRCRHASVTETALWVFDQGGKRQIASVSRLPGEPRGDYRWEVTRIYRGQPTARQCERTLLDCIGVIMRWEPYKD